MLTKKSKPLYQPWDEDAFVSSVSVRLMKPIQRWMYRTLLQASFVCPSRPYLPSKDDLLWMMAGCESKKQWDDNKNVVLACFAEINKNGESLLYHKHTLADWKRLIRKREDLAQKGRKGGIAKAKADARAKAMPVKRSEEKLSKSEVSEGEEDMRAVKQIPVTCLQVLGVKAEKWDSVWDEVKELVAAFGDFEVNQAFETWAGTRKGEALDRPVTEFLKVALGLLRGDIQVGSNEELVSLNANLTEIGGQPFTGRYYQALAAFLKKHPAKEIESAYREFCEGMDDFQRRMAPKNFIEGGAEATILARKNRVQKKSLADALMETTKTRLRVEAEADLAAKEKLLAEEEALIEDELPSG